MKILQKLRRTFSAIVWAGVVAATGLYSVTALAILNACDAKWHQNGELPDWANVSFSESNNPTPKPKRRRQKMANRKRSEPRSANPRARKFADSEFENPDAEDDGFLRRQVD